MARVLMKGNEAIAEAAVAAGCRYFFGYPITPQNELPEYLSKRLPEVGGYFVQAESEVSAINMVFGAGGSGGRVMTSSSSPGIALKQEGLSCLACAEVPSVIVNMMRGGPGIGSIQASQADYFQTVKGGGNGDYMIPAYAPATLQEACDLMAKAFDVAFEYRTPVMIAGDGMLGQMMEPVEIKKVDIKKHDISWATQGRNGAKEPHIVLTAHLDADDLEAFNEYLQKKYREIISKEVMFEEFNMDGNPEFVLVAYGTVSRICKNAIAKLKEQGVNVGLLRPITLWPFPSEAIARLAARPSVKAVVSVEMAAGQMMEDIKIAVNGVKPVELIYRLGSIPPSPDFIANKVIELKGRK